MIYLTEIDYGDCIEIYGRSEWSKTDVLDQIKQAWRNNRKVLAVWRKEGRELEDLTEQFTSWAEEQVRVSAMIEAAE